MNWKRGSSKRVKSLSKLILDFGFAKGESAVEFFVISRNTAFTYKGKPINTKQIGRELGVRYVLEGSAGQTGDRVQVNVQLINAQSGAHVWADRLETDRRDLAAAQREITGRLARTLNLDLVEDIARRIGQEHRTDYDPQDLVMLGEAEWRRRVPLGAA